MMNSGVYAIKNIVNGKRYIGSTANFAKRERAHFSELRRGIHGNHHLQNAYRKYGESAFRFVVLIHCEPDDLLDAEQAALDSLHCEYNIATDASAPMRGKKHTDEAKARISAAGMGRDYSTRVMPPMSQEHRTKIVAAARKRRSPETRRKMSLAQLGNQKGLGHLHNTETKAKISARMMGNTNTLGHELSEEHRRKISEARKGKTHSEETKAKCGIANLGNTYWLGRHHTEEARRKMSEARRAREAKCETS